MLGGKKRFTKFGDLYRKFHASRREEDLVLV